jgi:hypothetical protein
MIVLVGNEAAGAPGAPIYKCAQANGAVLYADYPCIGGEVLDIHPGAADPAASDRLARAQAELDRGAARRKANEALAAARREEAERMRLEAEFARGPGDAAMANAYPDATYGPVWVYSGPPSHHRTGRPGPPKRIEHRPFAPVAPMGPGSNQAGRAPSDRRPHNAG